MSDVLSNVFAVSCGSSVSRSNFITLMIRHSMYCDHRDNFTFTFYPMERSPWETYSHSASQEIPCLLWNLKVHYRVHNSPPLVPILSHMHQVDNFPHNFPKIHSNVILPSTPRSSEWSLPFSMIPDKRKSILFWRQMVTYTCNIWWGWQIQSLNQEKCETLAGIIR
jgi:hypothetical protein